MMAKEVRDPARAARLLGDANPQGFKRLEQGPGVERRKRGAGLAQEIVDMVGDELLARQDHAAEHAALAVDVFGGGVDDAIGAELQRMLQQRRGEHVVDDERRAGPVHDLGDAGDVDELERRIGRRFQERRLGVRTQRRPPRVKIRAVDEGRFDPETRQQFLDHIETRAEQSPRGDDVVARLELAHERGGDGGHAARGRARRLGAFEQRHPLLEHRDRRIAKRE